jgi:hypothetical protein
MSEPRITKKQGVFEMAWGVEVNIRSDARNVWRLLTDANGFPRWNSTLASIEGQIREGERLKLRVPGSQRTFTPKVSDVTPNERMTWADGFAPMFRGVRTFQLKLCSDGTTDFVMTERFSGVMLPLIKSSLPEFGPIFATYASDLKREAERATKEN